MIILILFIRMSPVLHMRFLVPLLAVGVCAAALVIWKDVSAQAGPAQAALSVRPVPSATAAAYIKFDGVDGESQDKDHKGWSELVSFSQGIDTTHSGAAAFKDVVVTKEYDKSSPTLAEAVVRGKVFPSVVFELTRSSPGAEPVAYLQYELTNVQVTSYSVGGSASDQPTETMSLNFEEIKVTYTETDRRGAAQGKVEYSWKVEEGVR
jgi:type VI secretion system secreted protein Hcp